MRTTLRLDDDVFRSAFRPGIDPLTLNQLNDEPKARWRNPLA